MKKITDYAELVKAKHALNKTIAPVEDGANIAGSYTSGKQFIREGVLYTALTTIAANTAWSSLTLDTDYELADDLTSQLASLNQTLTNQANAMVNVYGSKNILQNNLVSMSQDGVDFVVNEDKSITIDTNGQTVSVEQNGVALCHFVSEFSGDFILSNGNATLPSELRLMMEDATVHEWSISPQTVSMVKGHTYWVWIIYNAGLNIAQASAKTIYPMLREARIIDEYYEPYSMTNQQITPYVQAISNPNLLDNPWFTVNQRGQSSYSSGDGSSTFDRWKLWGGSNISATVAKSNDVITITKGSGSGYAQLGEKLEDYSLLEGKTLTMSVLLADGTIKSGTAQFVDASTNFSFLIESGDFGLSFTSGYFSIVVYGASKQFKAFKLELGSVSTLAQDTAPNYATELLKCQRYFYRHKGAYMYGGYFHESTTFRSSVKLPTAMRAIPSISFPDGIEYNQCGIYDAQGSFIAPSAVAVDNVNNVVGIPELLINSTTPTHTQYVTGVQRFNLTMDISAEL